MKVLAFAVAFACCYRMNGQAVSKSDSLYLTTLKNELILTDSQYIFVDSVYVNAQMRIVVIDKEVQKISRSDLQQEAKDEKVKALISEKKNLKEMRDLDIQLALTEEQKKIFEEKVKTVKPTAGHFGISHDRASCVVCLPK